MKKRLLSWLLVLTMVTSLIPSTLVTALAAELPSAQAATSTNGKTTLKLTNTWPTDEQLAQNDIVDVSITSSVAPGATVTVKDGQTLIFHGTGFLAGSSTNLTPLIVESGGHLVLDALTIQNNGVASTGAVYVKNGGLLDLGYNDRRERRAPCITENAVNSSVRNLVVEDGARVRQNAAAQKPIGIYYKGELGAPYAIVESGRYTQVRNDLSSSTICSDNTTYKFSLNYGDIYIQRVRPKLLFLDPGARATETINGVISKGNYLFRQNYSNSNIISNLKVAVQDTFNGTHDRSIVNPISADVVCYEYSSPDNTDNTQGTYAFGDVDNIMQYDVILINGAWGSLTAEGRQKLIDYLNAGGAIYFQAEDTQAGFDGVRAATNRWMRNLGATGFEAMSTPKGEGNLNAWYVDTADYAKRLTENMTANWHVEWTAPIKEGTGIEPFFMATFNDGTKHMWGASFLAGEREDGAKYGRLLTVTDGNWVAPGTGSDSRYQAKIAGQFFTNLLRVTQENRVTAAAGYNPNAEVTYQATTTTTTKATNYRTPYAALQKAVENNTITLLTESRKATGLTPTRDELLFEKSTLAYEAGSTYADSTIHADTAGVYIDITKTGEVNLYSGTVTVTPKDANYPLVLNGTMNADGNAITGGYKITATGAYTLDADDDTTKIKPGNGGGASITIPKAGTSVTVAYTGGTDGKLNDKTITYTATEDNEKFYLGCYTVSYEVEGNVTWTETDLAWDGHNFETKMTPASGYDGHGEKLAVVDITNAKTYDMENGVTEGTGAVTWGVFNSKTKLKDGATPKITVKQQYLHENNVDRNGYATVTVRNVREDITIRTTGNAVESSRPNIYVVGVGVKDGQRTQLWAYTTQRTTDDQITTKDVEGWPWAKWKVISAKTAKGTQAAYEGNQITTWTDQTIKNSTTAGGALCPVELTHGDMVVVFVYEWDMVNVKINAKLGEGDTAVDFPGYTTQYAEVQRNVESTIYAPNLSGYQPTAASTTITPTAGQDGAYGPYEVTFYYKLAMGQVIYRAVDADGHELATWDGPRVLQGDTVSTDYALAPKLAGYQVKQQNGNATAANSGTTDKYDGVNQITVTWVYEPKTRDVEVKMVEYDASKLNNIGAELRTDTTSYAKSPVGFTLNLSAPAIPGYTVKEVADNDEISKSKSVFVEDNDQGKLTVYFYYEVNTQDDAKITVQMWDKVNNEEIWSYTVPGQNGEKQLVRVPTVKGYVSDPSNKDTSIAPDQSLNADWGKGTVRFFYSPNTVTVKVKLVDSTKTAGDQGYELNTKVPNYTGSYTVVKGESIDIVAPDIYGYTLKDTAKSVYTVTVNPNETKTEIVETIQYVPISNQMVNIKVTGTVDGGDDLYTYTVQVAAGSGSYTIDAKKSITGYTLTSAKISSEEKINEITADGKLSVPIPDDAKRGTVPVTLTYKSTKTTVTVKTECAGTDLGHGYTVEKELNQQTSVFAPSIPGYTATEQNKTFTPDSTAATATQTFQYTKNTGNVVLIAKANGVELFRKDGGTKTKGDTINAADFAAPDVTYYQRAAADPTITVNGQAFTTGGQYDGIGQIEISYEYQRKTQGVTIIKKNVATGAKIEEQSLTGLEVGKSRTFTDGSVTVPSNYEPVADRNPTSYFVEDKANQTVTFWYKNTSADQYAQVKVNLICGGKVFQSYPVTAIKGQPTTIQAPTWTGYQLKTGTKASATVTPNGTEANDTVVFEYTIKDPKTVTVVLKDNSNKANPDAEMTAPTGYTKTYALKKGDTLEIWAPAMEGYALRGATLNGTESGNMQFVPVAYDSLNETNTVIFRYLPVAQANFVTHTVKFMLGTQELYSYDKKVDKGTGNVVSYPADAVKSMIPGYTYSKTTYEINGHSVNASDVKDNANAVIIYHFKEDTAQITIKFLDKNGDPLMKDGGAVPNQVLSGYRKGQKIEVSAPVLDDFALKTGEKLIQNVTLSSTESNNEISFKYEPLGSSYFFLKEKLTDGTTKIIAVVNAEENQTYNPNTTGNPLDLSTYGYRFTTDADKVGTDVSPEFKADGAGSVTTSSPLGNKVYTLYYVKGTRAVEFVPVNKDALDAAKLTLEEALKKPDFDTKYVIKSVTPVQPADARVGETYQAVAQSFNGWALQDDFSKLYTVENTTAPLKVYFLYEAKSTGDVTVHYHFGDKTNPGKLLNEYTIKAVVGEKVSISAPSYLMDNKYHLRDGQTNPYVLEVTNNTKEVEFYYEANFVTVTAKVVLDAGTAETHETYEVIKNLNTHSGSTTLYPPEKAGYTLIGITANGAALTNGGADKLPNEYTSNKLDLKGLTTNATVTYYYKTTKASEYQTELTVEYKYNGYDLAKAKKINANTGEANSIDIPAFDGYTASTYNFTDGSTVKVNGSGVNDTTVSVTPAEKTATLTITYTRPDGSIVLPGKGDKIGDSDDIIVKPTDPNTPPTLNPGPNPAKGSVTIPKDPAGNTGTVTRPKDPTKPADGKEDIIVPGGTTIDKDGTIHLPDGGGDITPEQKIPDALPDSYVAITYDSNNGSGDVKKEIGKKGELKVAGSLFTHPTNAKFEGWNDSGLGSGTAYAKDKTVDINITLYAKWSANYKYLATITYKPNGGTPDKDVLQNVGHDTDPNLKATLQSSSYQVSGWLFGGWNEKANGTGTLYQPNAILSLSHQDAKEFYAQWYKVNADGSITVPGEDGNPKKEDTNATAKGNGTDAPTRNDKGEIEVPKGGSVTLPDGSVIGMPDGGKLLPNGTVIINRPDKDGNGKTDDGTITIPGKTNPTKPDVTGKDGQPEADAKVIELVYQINNGEIVPDVTVKVVKGDSVSILDNPFTWTGYQFVNWMGTDDKVYAPNDKYVAGDQDLELHAQWTKQNDDGSIELPGKDGSMTTPEDNVLVTPDKPNGTVTKQPDGSVKVEGNSGTVNRPKDPDHLDQGKENIKVPEGTVVEPDGTIKLPDGTVIAPDKRVPDDVTPTNYFVVTYEPGDGSGDVIRQIVEKDTDTTLLGADTFTAPNGRTFDGWLDELDSKHDADSQVAVTKNTTLTAQWKDGTPTPPTQKYSADIVFDPNTSDATATQTVTSADSTTITRNLDAYTQHFTAPADWTFMGWSTTKAASQSSSFYADGAEVTLKDGDSLNLYAILYKLDADTKVITLPGKGGQPEGGDDVTVTPGAGADLTVDKGFIKAPAGSEIKQPANATPIKVIEGEVNVYPDGTVYVPEGSKVQLPDGSEIKGETTVDPDGTPDVDNTKPVQKPDGTIVLPGQNGVIGTGDDDITIAPAGPNQPAGRIDEDGNVTITNPSGADVNIPGSNPADFKVPNGTVIKPNGNMTLLYTIRYVDGSGTEIKTATVKPVQRGIPETVEAATITGYTVSGEATKTASGEVSANLADYTITFNYTKNSTGGGSSSGGGGGGGGSSTVSSYTIKVSAGNGGIISPSGNVSVKRGEDQTFSINPINGYRISDVIVDGKSVGAVSTYTFDSVKANHTIQVKFVKYNSIVADPEVTGVAGWLQTKEHNGYMGGYGNGLFGPNDNMTRAQVARMFYNLLLEKDVPVTVSFTDVPADAWYAEAVNTLASLGVIKGIGDGQFAPNRTITRAEFTVIAMRFANVSADVTNPFTDIATNDWYYTAVTSAVSYGWINGYGDGSFRPQATITRAEVVTIVNRMLNRTADRNFVDSNVTAQFDDVPNTYWAYYNIMEATIAHDHSIDNDGVESWGKQK